MANHTAETLNEDMLPKIIWVLVFTAFEIIVGSIGNVLVIVVFAFRYHKCSFRYFVLCLAFWDLLSVLTTLTGEMVTQIFWYVYPPIEAFCKIKSFCNVFTVCGEAFCLLIIAVDRYRKVCRPQGWQIHARNALILCLCTVLLSGIISIPLPVFWGIHTFQDDRLNVSITVCEKDENYVDSGVHKRYVIVIGAIMVVVLVATVGLYVPITSVLLKQRPRTDRKLSKNDLTSSKAEDCSTHISHANVLKICDITNAEALRAICSVPEDNIRCQKIETDICENVVSPSIGTTRHSSTDTIDTDDKYTPESSVALRDICSVPDDSSRCHETETDIRENVVSLASGTTRQSSTDTIDTEDNYTTESRKTKPKQKRTTREVKRAKRLQATKVPFVLSIIFTVTVVLYMALLAVLGANQRFLHDMSDEARSGFFFGLRLVFINHVINPFVYFVLDRQFKEIIKRGFARCSVNLMAIFARA